MAEFCGLATVCLEPGSAKTESVKMESYSKRIWKHCIIFNKRIQISKQPDPKHGSNVPDSGNECLWNEKFNKC